MYLKEFLLRITGLFVFMNNVRSSPFASGESYEDILEKYGINES